MQIKPSIVMGTLVITEHNGGYIHTDDNWPKSLDIHHVLRALCGPVSEDGWYSYWEGDRKWIAKCLQAISGMTAQQIGAMAMCDHAGIDGDDVPRSVVAAASLAVVLIERAFAATRDEARISVKMNVSKYL